MLSASRCRFRPRHSPSSRESKGLSAGLLTRTPPSHSPSNHMATRAMNDRVASYWPYIEYAAKKYTGWYGAEFDDLVQEGAIATWLFLENFGPHCPSLVWHRAMSNYASSMQTG